MDGTASLANREIGRVLPANYRKVSFSGAVDHLNRAATARYFGQLSRRIPRDEDSLAERGGFEPPVPLGLTWAEFGPSSAHYYVANKSIRVERICSPGVRRCFGSLRFPSFARLMRGIG